MRRVLVVVVLLVASLAGAAYWWLDQPLVLDAPAVDLSIEPGTSARGVANQVAQSGVQVVPELLYAWFRLSGQDRLIKAGSYEIETGTTPRSLLRKLVRGEESLRTVTLVEGWTFRQVRQALAGAPQLAADTASLTDDLIMQRLGRAGLPAEGRFFPDTYSYAKGSSDLKVLARALRSMDKHLADAWAKRSPDTPPKTPEQALVLGSIVEKETGRASDRPMIAGVFSNRLRQGMMLQTDPTVIYGIGDSFNGNLTRKHLETDTPYNTYTRFGLPPTPIALPGDAALLAVAKPAEGDALYFVAKGNGEHAFSATLAEHNRAVREYQLR